MVHTHMYKLYVYERGDFIVNLQRQSASSRQVETPGDVIAHPETIH